MKSDSHKRYMWLLIFAVITVGAIYYYMNGIGPGLATATGTKSQCMQSCADTCKNLPDTLCGDGIKAMSEQCEIDADCRQGRICEDCKCIKLPVRQPVRQNCGNQVREGTEQCDVNTCPAGMICKSDCSGCVEIPTVCGDNLKSLTEECDGTDLGNCLYGCDSCKCTPNLVCQGNCPAVWIKKGIDRSGFYSTDPTKVTVKNFKYPACSNNVEEGLPCNKNDDYNQYYQCTKPILGTTNRQIYQCGSVGRVVEVPNVKPTSYDPVCTNILNSLCVPNQMIACQYGGKLYACGEQGPKFEGTRYYPGSS